MKHSISKQIILSSTLIFSSHLYAAHTILLNNATSCEVQGWHDGTGKNMIKTIVPAVDVYSFFYANDSHQSRTYFGTIATNQIGAAVISEHSPDISPYRPMFNLGYSPSPGYTQGSASFISTTIDGFNNAYIFQTRDADNQYAGTASVLDVASRNPCADLETNPDKT